MTYHNHLFRFEQLARNLVEGSFDRLFFGSSLSQDLAQKVTESMDASLDKGLVADVYEIHLNPADYRFLVQENPDLHALLAADMAQLAEERGQILAGAPKVEIVEDPGLSQGEATVQTRLSQQVDMPTQGYIVVNGPQIANPMEAVDAYLIVNGKRHISLTKPVTTLGRMLENDIVLDDGTVSRQHAQIRWRNGRFVLYDLGSKLGTQVNAQRINECVLQAGDVLMIGAVPIIFGQEPQKSAGEVPCPAGQSESTLSFTMQNRNEP